MHLTNHHSNVRPPKLLVVAADSTRGSRVGQTIAAELPHKPEVVTLESVSAALSLLRTERQLAVIALHEPAASNGVDALALARALRGVGDQTPVTILGLAAAVDFEAQAWQAGADEYACLAGTTAEQTARRLSRSIDNRKRDREHRQLLQAEGQRLAREQEEAERLLLEQRSLIVDLESLCNSPSKQEAAAPSNSSDDPLLGAYDALLRSVVFDGIEIAVALPTLIDRLIEAEATTPRLVQLHLTALERRLAGLGSRSVRHVTGRADRLLLEATVHLAEAYRRRYVAVVEAGNRSAAPPFPRLSDAA